MRSELMAFREFEKDEVFACISGLIKSAGQIDNGYRQEAVSWYCDSVCRMAEAAEMMGIRGNLWQSWLAMTAMTATGCRVYPSSLRQPVAVMAGNAFRKD